MSSERMPSGAGWDNSLLGCAGNGSTLQELKVWAIGDFIRGVEVRLRKESQCSLVVRARSTIVSLPVATCGNLPALTQALLIPCMPALRCAASTRSETCFGALVY